MLSLMRPNNNQYRSSLEQKQLVVKNTGRQN